MIVLASLANWRLKDFALNEPMINSIFFIFQGFLLLLAPCPLLLAPNYYNSMMIRRYATKWKGPSSWTSQTRWRVWPAASAGMRTVATGEFASLMITFIVPISGCCHQLKVRLSPSGSEEREAIQPPAQNKSTQLTINKMNKMNAIQFRNIRIRAHRLLSCQLRLSIYEVGLKQAD